MRACWVAQTCRHVALLPPAILGISEGCDVSRGRQGISQDLRSQQSVPCSEMASYQKGQDLFSSVPLARPWYESTRWSGGARGLSQEARREER
jgi:hypothetical protein